MQHQLKRIADGFISLEGGMDSGRNPSILERNKVAYASNARFRGGFVRNRPGIKKLPLIFRKVDPSHSGYELPDTALQEVFEDNNCQGAAFYSYGNNRGFIFTVIGGRFFGVELRESNSPTFGGSTVIGHRVNEFVLKKEETTKLLAGGLSLANGASGNVSVGTVANITTELNSSISIGGTVFRLNSVTSPQTINITNLTGVAQAKSAGAVVSYGVRDTNSTANKIVFFCQAEQFLIVQDGVNRALIFDGASLRRSAFRDSRGQDEVPVGTVMAYGNGRLWVAVGGSYFIAGDIVGGPTGTALYNFNDSILKFTENDYLNEGGYFRVPNQAGIITAMRFIPTPDTSLGQGPLQVFTATHVFSVNVPVDRDNWKNLEFPIQTVSLISNGSVSDRSTVLVNGDIFFRAKDGIRSFVVARREMGDWGNTPLSNEVGVILDSDSPSLLSFASAVLFDNRLLMTADPVHVPNGCYHRSLIALDFHPISAMATRTSPAFDGVWNLSDVSANFVQLLVGNYDGKDRCFSIVRDSSGDNEVWEISKDGKFDYNGDSTAIAIPSYVETPSYPFIFGLTAPGSDAMQLKRLEMAEVFVDDIAGTVSFVVKFKPDQAPDWYTWHSWSETVNFQDCTNCVAGVNNSLTCAPTNYRARMRLPTPADTCETGQSKLARFGYEFQSRLEWTGSARIKKFRMQALEQQEEASGDCRS